VSPDRLILLNKVSKPEFTSPRQKQRVNKIRNDIALVGQKLFNETAEKLAPEKPLLVNKQTGRDSLELLIESQKEIE